MFDSSRSAPSFLVALSAFLAVTSLDALCGCAGTTVGASAHTAKAQAADQESCSMREIHELAGSEFSGGARYVMDVCGTRITYECDEETCERMCDYQPVASDYTGEGELEGEFTELAHRWSAAEFECRDIKQVEHSGDTYVMAVCGNEVVYECDDEGCRRDCD